MKCIVIHKLTFKIDKVLNNTITQSMGPLMSLASNQEWIIAPFRTKHTVKVSIWVKTSRTRAETKEDWDSREAMMYWMAMEPINRICIIEEIFLSMTVLLKMPLRCNISKFQIVQSDNINSNINKISIISKTNRTNTMAMMLWQTVWIKMGRCKLGTRWREQSVNNHSTLRTRTQTKRLV